MQAMVRAISTLTSNRIHQLSVSRGRKIRCDGAKPKCYHCSRREGKGNKECTYDAIPKRRGPDKTQRARTSGTRQETDGGPLPRRRHRGPITVDQAGSESDGITQQPRVTSILDTFENSTLFIHPQQYDACIHTLDPGFELLESMAGFSTVDPCNLSQMLTVDSASTRHTVSRPSLLSGYS
jgi:hypothetical protein